VENHKELLQLLMGQDRLLGRIYGTMAKELGAILKRYRVHDKLKVWHKNLQVKKEVDVVLKRYRSRILDHITFQTKDAWNMGEKHNDDFVLNYIKGATLPNDSIYLKRNTESLQAFLKRSANGLTLSQRVWNLNQQTRSQLEYFLADGLSYGRSAVQLAGDIKRYLKEPAKRFRRVRDKKTGKLSDPARNYHPGRGVYRSSYKNALRLTRNEINMAYRSADHERRKNLDFVLGIEVHLSPAHPQYDICDELQGKYPKDFKFTGWHPNCLCFTTSKLLPKEAFIKHLNGGKIRSNRYVNKIPERAENHINSISDKIKGWKNKPHFIADNFKSTKDGFVLKESIYPSDLSIPKIDNALKKTNAPNAKNLFASFEPFSPIIFRKLSQLRKLKDKQRLLESLVNDTSFKEINLGLKQGGTTKMHPLHRAKGKSWQNTKAMAKTINKAGDDVIFLPEYENKTSADAITKIKRKWRIVDFKHSTTTRIGTLKVDIINGFGKSEGIVLRLTQMNSGNFIEVMEELKRKKSKIIGDIKLINRLGKIIDLSGDEIKSKKYKKKIKGFF